MPQSQQLGVDSISPKWHNLAGNLFLVVYGALSSCAGDCQRNAPALRPHAWAATRSGMEFAVFRRGEQRQSAICELQFAIYNLQFADAAQKRHAMTLLQAQTTENVVCATILAQRDN